MTKLARFAVALGSLSLVYVYAAPLIRAAYLARLRACTHCTPRFASLGFSALSVPAHSAKAALAKASAPPLVAAVRAYNGRLRQIALLSARITRERQRLVQQVG